MARLSAAAASLVFLMACGEATVGSAEPPEGLDLVTETLAGGFDTIWELAWGPDDFIWVTERAGTVSRVNPQTGERVVVGEVPGVLEIGEGGLMGLAFHPDFDAQPWVYVVHTYGPGARNRVVRMRFESAAFSAPEVILDDIPGASIHNGSRLTIGPDDFLYVTTGDASDASIAQNPNALAGKVLRLALDGQPAPGNPFGTRIWSLGHRNPQGMAFATDGTLYITEHGPSDNDEVNLVEAGRNYGWPNVRGRCDGDAGSGEQAFCAANNVAEPLATWTPTVAPAGLVYYDHDLMPQLNGLLFASLKGETLYHLALAEDGRSVQAIQALFGGTFGRLRALLSAPDGTLFLGTSNRDGRGSIMSGDDRIVRIRPR